MSNVLMTKGAAPSAPAANKVYIYVDTADRRVKSIDENGVINTLSESNNGGMNILCNGGFRVQQRVATASTAIAGISTTTRAGVVADRWSVTASVASNLNWAQIDSSGTPEANLLSRYYGSIISSTAGKKVMISQFVIHSDMAHLRGLKVRVSVKINQKVGSAGQTYRLGLLYLTAAGTVDTSPAFLTGAWSTSTGVDPAWGTNLTAIAPDASPSGENGTITGSYLNILGSAAWVRSSAVFTVPSTAKNLVAVLFADATGGTTDNLSVAEFQITLGTDLMDFTEIPLTDEVLRCQRFFCKSFPLTVVPAASVSEATGGSGATGILGKSGSGTALGSQISVQFPVQMWKTPTTVTLFTPTAAGAVVFRLSGTSPLSQGTTAIRTSSTTDRGCVVTATNEATTNGAVGDLVGVHYTADAEFVA